MQNAIQEGRGNDDVGKDFVLLGEGLVGDKDSVRFLVPSGNELKERACVLDIHGEKGDPVDDEHSVLGQNFELIRQAVLKTGFPELFNELVVVDVRYAPRPPRC